MDYFNVNPPPTRADLATEDPVRFFRYSLAGVLAQTSRPVPTPVHAPRPLVQSPYRTMSTNPPLTRTHLRFMWTWNLPLSRHPIRLM